MLRWLKTFLIATILIGRAGAQSTANEFESLFNGQKFALRNYSADPVDHYKWENGIVKSTPPTVRALSIFTPRSVKLTGDKIVVKGERSTLLVDRKKNQPILSGDAPMSLEIDLYSTDASIVFPLLRQSLFFGNVNEAVAGLPMEFARRIPFDVSHSSADLCHCDWYFDQGIWLQADKDTKKFKFPQPISMPDPEYDERALKAHVSGSVSLMIHISETGQVSDLWLLRPLGYGLDEKAVDSVRHYKFKPAQFDGHVVATVLTVELNFRSF